jgi:hypothetical protein
VIASRLALDEEFTAWDENEHFAFAVTASKLPILSAIAESVRLEPVDDGTACKVTYRQGVQGRKGFGWAMKAAWSKAAKDVPVALKQLKARVESATDSAQ